jgi:hypothetical protein
MATKKGKGRLKEGTKVEVTWVDIAAYGSWLKREDAKKTLPVPMKSIGYVLSDEPDLVRIAMTSEMDGDGKVTEVMVIPRQNVVKVTKL